MIESYPIRANDIRNIQKILEKKESNCITVHGYSGTGKTYLIKNTLEKYFLNENDITIVYINLLDDILSTTALWDMFLFLTWNGDINDSDNILKVSKNQSFSKFLRKNHRNKKFINILLNSITSIVASLPFYNAQIEIGGVHILDEDDENQQNNNFEKADYVVKYFEYVAKKGKLILVIDNYQFMNPTMKIFFESGINKIKNNLSFINIQRTDNKEYNKPIAFENNQCNIKLENITRKEISIIFNSKFHNSPILINAIDDCYEKTLGNLKEIDIYIRKNAELIKKGLLRKNNTKNLVTSINSLPEIQRELILLATLFPAGIRLEYVTTLMKRFFYLNDDIIAEELTKLITLGYVMLNSSKHDLLKPAHDKIALSIDNINSTEDFIDFYLNIEDGLEEIVQNSKNTSDYIYLLHCYVGLCDSTRLIKKVNYLEELIKIKYNDCAFFYIVELTNEYLNNEKNVFVHLSKNIISDLLDSCQKTCSFETSQLLLSIFSNDVNFDENYGLYNVKVLTQLYKFSSALYKIKNIPETNESVLYKLIILEHLGKNEDVLNILSTYLNKKNIIRDKWYYLILRNTTHYFDYDNSYKNLVECLRYFEKCGTFFEQATIFNNLSVIQIWNGTSTFKEAEKNLKKSIKYLKKIGSNEIFEPYYNYGVLCFLQKSYKKSLDFFELALSEVPEALSMDVNLLNLNQLICKFAMGKKTIEDLEVFLLSCLNKANILQDPWVRFQIEYNLKNIELYLYKHSSIYPNEDYLINENNFTCLTVFSTLIKNNETISLCLSLSPNWRY